jgi:hypothetical protein
MISPCLKIIHLLGLRSAKDGTFVTCLKHGSKSSCSGYLNTEFDAKFRLCLVNGHSKGVWNSSCKFLLLFYRAF